MIDDRHLLNDLLDSEKLTDEQAEAFLKMRDDLVTGKYPKLTPRQRDWAEDLHSRFGLDPGAENLVSSGQMKVSDAERKSLQDFVAGLGPKHLRPPGRR
jgi:hypothetical protein